MSNIWTKFEKLLPKRKQFVAKVTSINTSNQTSTVQMLGGQSIVVKGISISVDKFCLIEDGVVKREVPELPVYNVTIF